MWIPLLPTRRDVEWLAQLAGLDAVPVPVVEGTGLDGPRLEREHRRDRAAEEAAAAALVAWRVEWERQRERAAERYRARYPLPSPWSATPAPPPDLMPRAYHYPGCEQRRAAVCGPSFAGGPLDRRHAHRRAFGPLRWPSHLTYTGHHVGDYEIEGDRYVWYPAGAVTI